MQRCQPDRHRGRRRPAPAVRADRGGLRAGASGDEDAVDLLLGDFEPVPLELATAEHAGRIRRKFGRNHGTDLVDALLAATTLERSVALSTDNRRHFPMPGLELR